MSLDDTKNSLLATAHGSYGGIVFFLWPEYIFDFHFHEEASPVVIRRIDGVRRLEGITLFKGRLSHQSTCYRITWRQLDAGSAQSQGDAVSSPLQKYYGKNLERLKQLKRQVDSENTFNFSHSIPLA